MTVHRALLACLLAVALAAPAAARAAPAWFSDPEPIGSGAVRQPAAAAGAEGTLALVWVSGGGESTGVLVARHAPGGAWESPVRLADGAQVIREPQVAVLRDGTTLVAWPEGHRDTQLLRYAVAPPGGPFGPARTLTRIGSAYGSGARLVALLNGRALLVWRDTVPRRGVLRYAIADAGSRRFGPVRSAGEDGVFPAVAALPGGGAAVAWATRNRRSRGLRFATLRAASGILGRTRTVSHDSVEGARLAAGLDGDVLMTWRSRRHRNRLYARELAPRARPARVLADGSFDVARVAVGVPRAELAVWRSFDQGYREWLGTASAPGEPFSARTLDEGPHGMVGVGFPAFTRGDGAVVVWTQSRDEPGPARYDVLVAERAPGEANFGAPQALSGGVETLDGAGLTVAQGGGRILAAWPAPLDTGGLRVAVREAA